MSFSFSNSREIESAYIIRLSNNTISVELSDRCMASCLESNMPAKFWEGVDGTIDDNIVIPDHLLNKDYLRWVKVQDNLITPSQLACVLSHFTLWCHCLTIDKPIVILEHDAIMLRKIEKFGFYNAIQYLGSIETLQGAPQSTIPLHGSAFNQKLRFICRAHAYAIDPQVARNMITRFIQNGVFSTTTADMFIRADIFSIVQNGLYAYDLWEEDVSTVKETL